MQPNVWDVLYGRLNLVLLLNIDYSVLPWKPKENDFFFPLSLVKHQCSFQSVNEDSLVQHVISIFNNIFNMSNSICL